jgi:hypothetical protein
MEKLGIFDKRHDFLEKTPKYSGILSKKLLILAGFLLVSGLCFSQQRIRVIGAIPCSDTGKSYNVQIGAFRITANAETATATLRGLGFTPGCEQYGNLTRVFAAGIPASELRSCLDRLENAGIREVIIRESSAAPVTVPPPEYPAVDTPSEYPDETTATVPPVPALPQRTELLCRSWRSQTIDGENIQGTESDHVLSFAADGTYSITYLDTDFSVQGQWKWKEDSSQDILYTWDSWNTNTTESIIEVTDNQLRMWQDSGSKRIWESVPSR